MAAMVDFSRVWQMVSGRRDRSERREMFDGPVGGGPAPTSAALDRYVALALIDRSEQARTLRQKVTELAKLKPLPPLLVVLPFQSGQMHSLFVDRFGKYELPHRLRKRPCCFRGQLQWPTGQPLAGIRQELAADDVIRSFLEGGTPPAADLCFSFAIEDAQWRPPGTKAVVADWVEYVLEQWPRCTHGNVVVCFLCLDTADPSGKPEDEKKWIGEREQLIRELRVRYAENGSLLVLEAFAEVHAYDIDEWLGVIERELCDDRLKMDLLAAKNELFASGKGQPMAIVHNRFVLCLRECDPHPVRQ